MKFRSTAAWGLWPIYIAYFISQLGNWAFRASVLYEIYSKQGGSSIYLGSTVGLIYGSILIGSRLLAPLADRFSSKRILIGLDVLRSCVLLPLLVWSDLRQTGNVILTLSVVVILSLSSPLFTAAQQAYIRQTQEKDRVTNAVAMISNIDWLTYLLGTVAGSLLLLKVDFRGIVSIDLVTFVCSMLLLTCFLRAARAAGQRTAGTALTTEASRVRRPIYYVLFAIFLLNLGAGVNNIYPNVIAHDVYHTGQVGLSILYLGNGIGGFLGALCVRQVKKVLKPIHLLIVSSLCIAASLVGMSVFVGMAVSTVADALMLFFGQIFGIIACSYLLLNHPVEQAGKASGLFTAATFAGVAANALIFSIIQPRYTLQTFLLFLVFCAISAFSSLFLLAIYDRIAGKISREEVALAQRKDADVQAVSINYDEAKG